MRLKEESDYDVIISEGTDKPIKILNVSKDEIKELLKFDSKISVLAIKARHLLFDGKWKVSFGSTVYIDVDSTRKIEDINKPQTYSRDDEDKWATLIEFYN